MRGDVKCEHNVNIVVYVHAICSVSFCSSEKIVYVVTESTNLFKNFRAKSMHDILLFLLSANIMES